MKVVLKGAVLWGSLGAALSAFAQDAPGGGQLLTINVAQSLSYQSNPDLTPGGGDAGWVALTDFSVGFSDQTRTEAFTLSGNTGLRLDDAEGLTIATPRLGFGYERESADAALSISGSWSRAEIGRLATLADFVQEDGTIELPVDFDLLDPRIDGDRTNTSLGARLVGGRTAPLGYSLSARLGQVTYSGDAADQLTDSQTLDLSGGLDLRLDPVTRAGITLRYTRFEEDGSDAEERWGLSADIRRDRPLGPLSFGISADETGGGTRIGLNASRSIAGPRTQLTFGAGLSSLDGEDWTVTGQVRGRYALPEGAITFGAQRSYATAADGADRLVTALSTGYAVALTPVSGINAGIEYLESAETDGRVRTLNLSTAYARQLTPDWAFNTGVTLTERRETGFEAARNQSVFLSLSRSFTFRP